MIGQDPAELPASVDPRLGLPSPRHVHSPWSALLLNILPYTMAMKTETIKVFAEQQATEVRNIRSIHSTVLSVS